MTKLEHIRDAWKICCNVYGIPHDETNVYGFCGHWFGQTRRFTDRRHYNTVITSLWLIRFKVTNDYTAEFHAELIKKYDGYEQLRIIHPAGKTDQRPADRTFPERKNA